MGKKQTPTGNTGPTKKAAPRPIDRTEYIRRGREVLGSVKGRVDQLVARRAADLLSAANVSAKTEAKYESEEIVKYAYESDVSEEDVRVDVQLAKLVNALADAELEDAVTCGRLRLTKSLLADLVKLISPMSSGDLEQRVRELLDEQI